MSLSPLWCPALEQRPSARDFETDVSRVFLGLAPNHETKEHDPVYWHPDVQGFLLCCGIAHETRLSIAALAVSAEERVLVVCPDPVQSWDRVDAALESESRFRGLVAPDLDVALARMPAAWRDDFIERVFGLAQRFSERGLPVMIGLSAPGALLAKFEQLTHVAVDLPATAFSAHVDGVTFTVGQAEGTWESLSTRQDSTLPLWSTVLSGKYPSGVVVTHRPALWRQGEDARVTVSSPDDYLTQKYSREIAPEHILIVDDCSPAEFRSLRVSAKMLPPPENRTAFALFPDGKMIRVDITSLWVEGDHAT